MLGNYRVAAQLVASQVVLSSTELIIVDTGLLKPASSMAFLVSLFSLT
jgi:hypothetical protein